MKTTTVVTEKGEKMSDLISRQMAINAICVALPTLSTLPTLCKTIEDLPSADVVNCEDCKYVGTDATCCLVCNRDGMGLKPFHVYHDDYCSYGERRGDE